MTFDAAHFADKLADEARDRLRYVQAEKRWYLCSQTTRPGYWSPEDRHGAQALVVEMLRASDECVTTHKVQGILAFARSKLAALPKHFNADPWLFGVRNGVVDLLNRKLISPVDPSLLLTMRGDVDFDPDADHPHFSEHIKMLTGGDEGRATLLRLEFGIALVGHDSRKPHLFVPIVGSGNNGKGTLMRAQKRVFGDYAHTLDSREFTHRPDRHSTSVADLQDKRFIVVEEIPNNVLNTAAVKNVTGGDDVTARHLNQRNTTFKQTWTIFMTANQDIKWGHDLSVGVRRRLGLVRAEGQIAKPKSDWEDKLADEASGILNWNLSGLHDWVDAGYGLVLPDTVREDRDAALDAQDFRQMWLEHCVELGDPNDWTPTGLLFKEYGAYREKELGLKDRLRDGDLIDFSHWLGGIKDDDGKKLLKSQKKSGERGWYGIKLTKQYETLLRIPT